MPCCFESLDPKKAALEDAISMQAQSEKERQARVILGDSERQVAEKFGEAAKTYADNPIALNLQAMNMLYEGLKDNATIVIVPSTAFETIQLGGLAGMTSLTMGKRGWGRSSNRTQQKESKMPIQFNEENGGKMLVIHVTGKLEKADYEHFMPEFERLVLQHGKLRVLFDMNAFHGWEASAAWEDFKFGMKHFSDIERLAMVGEERWQHGMAIFCKPFTKATVRYFDQADSAEARKWLAEV